MIEKMNDVRLLRADEIECRVGQVKKDGSGCSLLLYKDARVDMRVLDETVGPGNWMRSHRLVGNNLYCRVSIWSNELGMWGIGRELYTAPFVWINYTEEEKKGAFVKFKVADIGYDEKRNISRLVIVDTKGTPRYEWTKGGKRC